LTHPNRLSPSSPNGLYPRLHTANPSSVPPAVPASFSPHFFIAARTASPCAPDFPPCPS
jgi:hypothetical protein